MYTLHKFFCCCCCCCWFFLEPLILLREISRFMDTLTLIPSTESCPAMTSALSLGHIFPKTVCPNLGTFCTLERWECSQTIMSWFPFVGQFFPQYIRFQFSFHYKQQGERWWCCHQLDGQILRWTAKCTQLAVTFHPAEEHNSAKFHCKQNCPPPQFSVACFLFTSKSSPGKTNLSYSIFHQGHSGHSNSDIL